MNADWTAGYVTDIGYTFGYYGELNPLRSRLALIDANIEPPQIQTACELGFGQGLSANIHAAASNVEWYGTDFNPSQAAFAREAAMASGAKLWDEAFADFTHRTDLPDFDFISLHGIWSWISDANRNAIVDFIRRKLKPGGIAYISYNTMAAWAPFLPIRQLMVTHADILGAGQGPASRVDGALDFIDRLLKTNPCFAAVNPHMTERFTAAKALDRHYLAHEYFNRDWHPMHFADMARWLAPAKLSYASSAYFLDHVDAINLTADQQSFLKEITDPILYQSARDLITGQSFRRDYWVKGSRSLNPFSRQEHVRRHRVQLTVPRSKVALSVKGALGDAGLAEHINGPILDLLSDLKPRTLGEIEKELAGRTEIRLPHIRESVLLLGDVLQAAQDDGAIARARPQTDRFNRWMIGQALEAENIPFLASPVTGGGIQVSCVEQLFLHAVAQGHKTPRDWAEAIWKVLSSQGKKMIKDGVTLEDDDANRAEVLAQAEEFAKERLAILKALGIA